MARHRVTPLFPVAVAPSRLAELLGVHRKHIDRAVSEGELKVYVHGKSHRILIQDCVDWIRSTWRLKGSRHIAPTE